MARFDVIEAVLGDRFTNLQMDFPRIDELTEFYQKLLQSTIDVGFYKKSCSSLIWAVKKTKTFSRMTRSSIAKTNNKEDMAAKRGAGIGRIASVVKQIAKFLNYLEECRQIFRKLPNIKSNLYTVAITGFPNVGKTTILSKITPSDPEINNYAFTTKKVNVGYMLISERKVQLLDTPGTLNRFNKMNSIEKQAHLAMEHYANIIVFVIDLTESSYPYGVQIKLLEEIKKYNKPIKIYLSKTDLLDAKTVDLKSKELKAMYNVDELEKLIQDGLKGSQYW